MELYRRKPGGPWYVDLTDPTTGQRVRKSTRKTTKRDADQVAFRLQKDIEAADGLRPITLTEALENYARSLEGRSPSGAASVRAITAKTLGTNARMSRRWALAGSRWLHSLTPQDIDDLLTHRSREGNAPQTIAHEVKNLRAASRHAAGLRRRGASLVSWRIPRTTPKLRYLSPEEYRLVYDWLAPDRPIQATGRKGFPASPYGLVGTRRVQRQDSQDLLVALATTGARWGEIAGLTWPQVDLDDRVIRLWGSKTDQERLIGLSEGLVDVLERRQASAATGVAHVFPGASGERRAGSCRPIIRAMTDVGLNRPDSVARYGSATIHSLRHTFASTALQGGADLAEVQQALGHASLQMTLRYAHLARGKTARKLAGLVGSALDIVTTLVSRLPADASTRQETDLDIPEAPQTKLGEVLQFPKAA